MQAWSVYSAGMKNRHYNPAKKHHRPDGFQNNYASFQGKRWHEILRWRVCRCSQR
jgi:hypothetical protein